jgi:hypothetical protein
MVTMLPPDTGLIALIVSVVVLDVPRDPRWVVYTHFSPTATGNRAEPAAVVLPEPELPDPLDEAEFDGEPPEPPEPPEPDPPELPEPPDEHPATSSAATARAPAIRPAK